MNSLNLSKSLLDALNITIDEFLNQNKADPKFYCNEMLNYCEDRGYEIIRNIRYDEVNESYEITYNIAMPTDKDVTMFLLLFPQ